MEAVGALSKLSVGCYWFILPSLRGCPSSPHPRMMGEQLGAPQGPDDPPGSFPLQLVLPFCREHLPKTFLAP